MAQNRPCRSAASAAVAAAERVRVRLRQRELPEHERELIAEVVLHRFTSQYASPQYGHWKSPYSTSCIGASAGRSDDRK